MKESYGISYIVRAMVSRQLALVEQRLERVRGGEFVDERNRVRRRLLGRRQTLRRPVVTTHDSFSCPHGFDARGVPISSAPRVPTDQRKINAASRGALVYFLIRLTDR